MQSLNYQQFTAILDAVAMRVLRSKSDKCDDYAELGLYTVAVTDFITNLHHVNNSKAFHELQEKEPSPVKFDNYVDMQAINMIFIFKNKFTEEQRLENAVQQEIGIYTEAIGDFTRELSFVIRNHGTIILAIKDMKE